MAPMMPTLAVLSPVRMRRTWNGPSLCSSGSAVTRPLCVARTRAVARTPSGCPVGPSARREGAGSGAACGSAGWTRGARTAASGGPRTAAPGGAHTAASARHRERCAVTQSATSRMPSSEVRLVKTTGRSAALRAWRRAAMAAEVGADVRGQVGLVDDEQVGGGDAGAALAGDVVAARDVDDEDLRVDQALGEGRGEVVAAGLDEHQVERAEPRPPGPRRLRGWRRCRRGWRCAGRRRSRPR